MTDPFAQFGDLVDPSKLPKNYDVPGKRPPANRSTKVVESPDWDSKPAVYNIGNKTYEFFTIGHLADAIDKAPPTIRAWEARGLLPHSPFRSPTPRFQPLRDKKNKGRRLWTREQIEGILTIANEEGCVIGTLPPPTKQFIQRVTQLFYEIYIASDFNKDKQ